MTNAHSDETTIGDLPLRRFLTFRMARVQAKLNAQASHILREQAGLTLRPVPNLVDAIWDNRPPPPAGKVSPYPAI